MAPVKKKLAKLGRTYIAEWRDSRGLTQEQLAEGINMSRSALSKIETSDAPYTQRTLEAIADVLRCKPQDLLVPVVPEETKSPRVALRSALLAFGVDHSQLDLALSIIEKFVPASAIEEPPKQSQPSGQSRPSSRHRAPTP
nr:helix-turn-helix domain-containing protein [Neorhizobium tomejilense]